METSEFAKEILRLNGEMERTDHVGRHNRFSSQLDGVFERISALPTGENVLRALLSYPDPDVRMTTAFHCGWQRVLVDEAENVALSLADEPGELGRRARSWLDLKATMTAPSSSSVPIRQREWPFSPPPEGLARQALAELINRRFPNDRAPQISSYIREAIRIWPAPLKGEINASRFGGLPVLPPDTDWPSVEEEPLVFLGQINLADLGDLAQGRLPRAGLLLFFGDHDEVEGCGPNLGSRTLFFETAENLEIAAAPVDYLKVNPQCGLAFYPTVELPDPRSEAVTKLDLNDSEAVTYEALYRELGNDYPFGTDISKIFGWPNLIQQGLVEDRFADVKEDDLLLLQIGSYVDGKESHGWGPGGVIYFTLSPDSMTRLEFSSAEMSVQNT